jgi:hypothetical protein
MASDTKVDPWALLREARESVDGVVDSDHPVGMSNAESRAVECIKRIDAALAARDTRPNAADIKWEEKDSNRHGISPHEADYSEDVFLTVEKHWLCGQWLWRVEYVDYAASMAEAKAKAVEYAGRLP